MPPLTFVQNLGHILVRCIEEKCQTSGVCIHEYMHKIRLDKHSLLRSLLALMLIAIPNGQTAFHEFVRRNVLCIDPIIRDLIQCKKLQQAIFLFEIANVRNSLYLSDYTFVALLKVSADLQDEDKGDQLRTVLSRNGLLERNLFVGNAMVNMYAKCGSISKALEIFENLRFRDVVSWTVLMAGLISHDFNAEALDCFENMQLEGIFPNVTTVSCCLKACGSVGAVRNGKRIHVNLFGLVKTSIAIGNALIDMYAKCGFLVKAQEVFDEMMVHDVVSWTALIAGYVSYENGSKALNLYDQMQLEGVPPNEATFVCSLKACGIVGAKEKGISIHEVVVRMEMFQKDIAIGNALIDMYAKCCLLSNAHNLFEELPIRDVVSWTAMISIYNDNGLCQLALYRFNEMQLEGILPNAYTYACTLRTCGDLSELDKGQEIHAEIMIKGFSMNDNINSSLIEMYSGCGSFDDAHAVLDKHALKNINIWNSLISGYVKHGQAVKALKCLHQIANEDVTPNSSTLVFSLKACGCVGDIYKGQEIHVEIVRKGLFGKDIVMGHTLLDMYINNGAFAKAQEVFDNLQIQNSISWNSLISGYAKHGLAIQSLNCFKQMPFYGIYPDLVTLVWMLRVCGILGAIDTGKEIHEVMYRGELFKRNSFLGEALVEMYAKCGSLGAAENVLHDLSSQDPTPWNSLIVGYSRWGYDEEALNCFKQMRCCCIPPNAITFSSSLKACSAIGALQKGMELHVEMIENGSFNEDIAVGNALVDMYAKCGCFAKAHEVLEKLPWPDEYSWTALITGYIKQGNYEEVLNCYDRMQLNGVLPNAVTLSCVLKACGCLGIPRKGEQIYDEISSREFLEDDMIIGNSLIHMYAECGWLAKAQETFDKLLAQDAVSWTVLIAGYAKQENNNEALCCFQQMQIEGFLPDTMTFVCVLQVCINIGAMVKGGEVHEEASRRGFADGDVTVGNALIDLYAKCGAPEKAQEVFDRLTARDITSWNALISGYVLAGENASVFSLFDRMKKADERPNIITFISILAACCRSGLVEKSETYFESISKDYGIMPILEHYSCMVNIFCRAGYLARGVDVINKMPFDPDLVLHRVLMDNCKKWGSAELGINVFERDIALKKMCSSFNSIPRHTNVMQLVNETMTGSARHFLFINSSHNSFARFTYGCNSLRRLHNFPAACILSNLRFIKKPQGIEVYTRYYYFIYATNKMKD